jgi:hypothetical protein
MFTKTFDYLARYKKRLRSRSYPSSYELRLRAAWLEYEANETLNLEEEKLIMSHKCCKYWAMNCTCTSAVDWTKPIQTTDGQPARLLAQDVNGINGRSIAVAYKPRGDTYEQLLLVRPDGVYTSNSNRARIVNVPKKKVQATFIYHGYKFTCEMYEQEARDMGIEYECIC